MHLILIQLNRLYARQEDTKNWNTEATDPSRRDTGERQLPEMLHLTARGQLSFCR